jgi:diacylglycerol kinase family enzyme
VIRKSQAQRPAHAPNAQQGGLAPPDCAGDFEASQILSKRVVAVLNTGSGSCDASSADRAKALFKAAGATDAQVVSATPAELDKILDRAVLTAEVVVVLGGDGTVRSAAAKCGAADVPLIPLPGGTMNMLPKALYGQCGWERALSETLADPSLRDVSSGVANDHPFYCVAILGGPALWADARESLRAGRLGEALQRSITALRRHSSGALNYEMDSQGKAFAEAVAVICPLVSRAMGSREESLEAAALDPKTAAAVFSLAVHAVVDDWRLDPSVLRATVRSIRVRGHGRVPVILDGETMKMGREVNITFRPLGFRAVVPCSPAPDWP